MNNKIIITIVILFSCVIGLFVGLNDKNFLNVNSSNLSTQNLENISTSLENPSGNNINSELSTSSGELISSGESENIYDNSSSIKSPKSIKAVYSTGWVMGTPNLKQAMISSIKENGYNAIVIDIKDEAGQLSYDSNVQTAKDIKSSRKMVRDIKALITELKENDIYVIGRIVTFKDPTYASKVTSIAYKNSDGSVWHDYNGNAWPNPYNKDSWNYPIELAKEAAELGFEEIQFDYIRFPSSEGRTKNISYGFESANKSKSEMINEFLETVMKELSPYNVIVSADVFGITTKKDGDFENIGQDFAKISSIVDVICPMVYPSHYAFNEYKISKPDKEPYQIVYKSIEDGFKRINSLNHSGDANIKTAIIRPYLQDFTASWLGKGNYLSYGTKEVTMQIQACYDLNIEDFCLWDPSNKYCYSALKDVIKKDNISGDDSLINVSGEV